MTVNDSVTQPNGIAKRFPLPLTSRFVSIDFSILPYRLVVQEASKGSCLLA